MAGVIPTIVTAGLYFHRAAEMQRAQNDAVAQTLSDLQELMEAKWAAQASQTAASHIFELDQ